MNLESFNEVVGYSLPQKFFVQRLIELLHRRTIDSYRLRVMNPYLILLELREVYDGFLEGRVKNFHTLEYCIKEVIVLFENDEVLSFEKINKNYLVKELLPSIKKDNAPQHHSDVCNALKIILEENKNYTQLLLDKVIGHIEHPVEPEENIYLRFEKIDRLTSNLVTEFIRIGYSKSYLFRYFFKVFIHESASGFANAFGAISQLTTLDQRQFQVWFKIIAPGIGQQDWRTFSGWEVRETIADLIGSSALPDLQKFGRSGQHVYLGLTIQALDHYSALAKGKQRISENLDIIQLAYHKDNIKLIDLAWVIDEEHRDDSGLQKVGYIPDGNYPRGREVLPRLQAKIPNILASPNIAIETKEKLKSAVRYLRYGIESVEVEHQFINYWIGIEYLFSNDRDPTFTRIKEILPALQVLLYLRRNLADFFRMTKQPLRVFPWRHFDPENIDCLLSEETFEEIKQHALADFPLLSYRSWKFKKRLFDDKNRKDYLNIHQDILEQHLTRVYRFRNEIVHEARHGFDNQTLASNLKYYLVFSLSIMLDYFSRLHPEEHANLEDFFALQRLKLNGMKFEKYPLEKLLHLDLDFEMLT